MTASGNEYAYFTEMHHGYNPPRVDGLWRRSAGDVWEYLSLVDWQWHPVGEMERVKGRPLESALEPVSAQRAAELAADRQGWVQYWALYLDEQDFREGVDPVTVVRRRSSPDRVLDEAFVAENKWAPDPIIYDFTHSRTDNHLEEIDVAEAERLLQKLRGVKGATEL